MSNLSSVKNELPSYQEVTKLLNTPLPDKMVEKKYLAVNNLLNGIPSSGIYSGSDHKFDISISDSSLVNMSEAFIHFDISFYANTTSTALAISHVANLPSQFNFIRQAKLKLDSKPVCEVDQCGTINWIKTALCYNKESIRSQDPGLRSWNTANNESDEELNYFSDGTTTYLLGVSDSGTGTAWAASNTISITGAAGTDVTLAGAVSATDTAITLTPLTLQKTYLKDNLYSGKNTLGIERKAATLDLNSTAARVQFRVPLSYIFPMFDTNEPFNFLPLNRLGIDFTRNTDSKVLIGSTSNVTSVACVLNACSLYTHHYKLRADYHAEFMQKLQGGEAIQIPYLKYHVNESITCSTSGAIVRNTSHYVSATALFQMFHAAGEDVLKYDLPNGTSTTTIVKRVVYGNETMPDNYYHSTYFDYSSKNWVVPYEDYKEMCKLYSPQDARMISYREFEYNPIFCTKLNYNLNNSFSLDKDSKQLTSEITCTAAANTVLTEVIACEKVLLFDLSTGRNHTDLI